MITEHAQRARLLGEQLGLPDAVLDALVNAYEQWDGKGWPGEAQGEAVPIATRVATLAEFMEVAHRVSGIDAACAMARQARGQAVRPPARAARSPRTPRRSSTASTTSGRGTP